MNKSWNKDLECDCTMRLYDIDYPFDNYSLKMKK